jgi:hypothetical protein
MKINIETKTKKLIELPQYLRSNEYQDTYIMTVGENAAVKVQDREFNNDGLEIFPKIEIVAHYIVEVFVRNGFTPISEAEFKNAYIRTSLTIEKLLN